MNPAPALINPTLLERFMRSAATNAPLGLCIVGAFAAIHFLVGRRSKTDQETAFLKALSSSNVPNSVLLTYTDALDPLEMARRHLGQAPDETSGPIREALAATF